MMHSPDDASAPVPRTAPRPSRLIKILVVAAGTVGVVYGGVWWQDRPIREIQQKLDRKQPELALAQANAYLAAHPDETRVLAFKARALLDSGKTREAVQLFEQIGLANPAEMHALARGYIKLLQWTRAITLLNRVMSSEPRNSDALQDLIGCQFQMGITTQGLANSEALAKLPNHQARGLAWRAFFLNSLDDRRRALEAFQQTLEVSPDAKHLPVSADDFFLRYGQALLADEKLDAARAMIERSIAARPTAAALASLAQLQERTGQKTEALKSFARALELDPSQPDACEALAAQALAAGEVETAQRRLKALGINSAPRKKTAEILVAILDQTGDVSEARRWREHLKRLEARQPVDDAIQRLMRHAPESFWANVVRAHDFATMGNWAQAQAVLEPFQEQGAKEPFVVELWAALQQQGPLPSLERLPLDEF